MQKVFPLILSVFFLSACNAPIEIGPSYDEESRIYEYASSDESESVYLEIPASATILEEMDGATLTYGDCNLWLTFDPEPWPDVHEAFKDDVTFQSLFSKAGNWVKYRGIKGNVGIEVSLNIPDCMAFVDDVANSLSDEPVFFSDNYGFSMKLLEGWKTASDEGNVLVMKKNIIPEKPVNFDDLKEKEQRPYLPFDVEIGVSVEENPYDDLSDLVVERYQGYSVDFMTLGSVYGVEVGDQEGENSLKSFFFMSPDGEFLYEAYINIWSIHYNEFAETFHGVVSTIELF